jgi:hypothetical protein
MDMPPKLTEEHRKLEKFAGTWTGEETIQPSPWDPKGGKAKSKQTARMDLDGFWVIIDYQQEREGKVSYRGHGVYGYDPNRKQYAMFWFDSIGMVGAEPAWGKWEGDTLTFESKSPMGWGRYTYKFKTDGSQEFRIDNSPDGKNWKPFLEGKYRKTG